MHITLKRYETIEDLICPFFQIHTAEIPNGSLSARDNEGNRTEIPIRHIVDVIRQTGIWGYTDDTGCIHYWRGQASFQNTLEFFAHEIAHNTGRQHPDKLEEEKRADEYARVAVMAYGFATSI